MGGVLKTGAEDPWAYVWRASNPVRRVRIRRGKSRQWLAAKTGLDYGTIMHFENGKHKASVSSLFKCSIPLRLPVELLLQAYEAWWELRPRGECDDGISSGTMEAPVPAEGAAKEEGLYSGGSSVEGWSDEQYLQPVGERSDPESEDGYMHKVRGRIGPLAPEAIPRSPWMVRSSPHRQYSTGFLRAGKPKAKGK